MTLALVSKDLKLFFRNQFFAVITVLGLVAYIAIYFLLPTEAQSNFELAVFIEDPATTAIDEQFSELFDYTLFESEAALRQALEEEGTYVVGMVISADATAAIARGEATTIDAFYAPGIPAETRQVYDDLLLVAANAANPAAAANFLRLEETSITLGDDIYDEAITVRDRIVPMLLLFILGVEVLGLATLIMRDVENGTARALITGPVRLPQFFASKAIMGMSLALVQLIILVAITGKLGTSPLLVLVTLLLGSFLIVGFGFIIAAIARDNMSVLAWGMLLIIVFVIPAITIMLPGLASGWIEVIPSFFLVDTLHRVLNFGAGWSDVGPNLLLLLTTGAAAMLVGAAALRRRF